MSDFAFVNEEECFMKKETSAGTLIKPATADRCYTVGPVEFSQEQEFLEDEQIRSGASMLSPIKGRKMAGEWSGTTYFKPSGTLGTEPEHTVLLEALMGAVTITPATKVTYSLANTLPSFSLWMKKGHTVYAARGVTANSADFNIAGEEIATIGWGGGFMEQLWAGTGQAVGVHGSGLGVITLKTGHAQRYTKDMYITVGVDDNSGAGYRITDVNYTTDKLDISPVLAVGGGSNPTIDPWWPTSGVEVGAPVHGKTGWVTIDGVNAVVITATLSMVNNIKYYDYEKNNLWTAEQYGRPGKREISGELGLHFIESGPSYWYRSEYQISNALVIPAGKIVGRIVELNIPYAEYETSVISGDEEFIHTIPYKAIASSSLNDEFNIIFK